MSDSMPTISVIVPVYKVEPYLHRCIDSILAQTFTDFELILVDDGSPDNSGVICDEYALEDSRIISIHKPNGGVSSARNVGLDFAEQCSNSKWIFYIDSDDWVCDKCIELLVDASSNLKCTIVFCGYQVVKGSSSPTDWKQDFSIQPHKLLTEDIYLYENYEMAPYNSIWGKLIYKTLFSGIRFPIGSCYEDRYTNHRVFFRTEYIACLFLPLYYYYESENSITRREWSLKRLEDLDACEEQLLFLKNNHYRKAYLRIARQYINLIIQNIDEVKINYRYNIYTKMLRKRLRSVLKHNRGYEIDQIASAYRAAYPILGHRKKNRKTIFDRIIKKYHMRELK